LKVQSEHIIDLTVKYIDSTLSEEEAGILQVALAEDPENRKLFDELTDTWQASLKARKKEEYDEKAAWRHLKNSLSIPESHSEKQPAMLRSTRLWQIAATAAVFLMLVTGGMFIFKGTINDQSGAHITEYFVPLGSRSKITLPDGSSVWLNAGSKLTFDGYFSHKNRKVFLEGEGYFDVVKTKIPFFVNVSGAKIKVLGTAFNVKAYPEEQIIETTVARGTVQVFEDQKNTAEATHIILYANQKVSIIKNTTVPVDQGLATSPQNAPVQEVKKANPVAINSYRVDRNVVPEIYTSWKDQRWIIEREELQSLAVKLERRYNVTFSFRDESLKQYVFSGILKDETLEQVLEAIKLTAPIQYQIDRKQVILYKNTFYNSNQR
jgi:ferric-dicitrate binding protein FerR (iron transport regulator)